MLMQVRNGKAVALLCLVAAAVPASGAAAREGTFDDARASAEPADQILVTATKKAAAEPLQAVPLAISVFGGDDLVTRKVTSLQDLSYAVPGVSLDSVGTFRGTANFAIRGLGINSSIASVDPAVGTFVDGVYLGINSGAILDLADVASVEVLRGPQGVLFGRNTTGGAVLINTADPASEWSALARGTLETPVDSGRGGVNATAQSAITGPLGAGVAARLSVYYNDDAGYFRNRLTGRDFGAAETLVLRGGLSLALGDALKVVIKGEYLDSTGDGAPGQNHGLFARDSFDLSLDQEGYIDARSDFVTLRADYALGDGAITNIAGWRRYRQFTFNDIDSTPAFVFHSKTATDQEQWSNELRYASKVAGADLTIGGYLFHQDVAYQEDRVFPTGAPAYGGGTQDHDVYGVFGQVEAPLTAAVSLNAGLRWSREEKDAGVTFVRTRTGCSVLTGTCPTTGTNPMIAGEANGFEDSRSWESWAPKLGLSYQPTPQVLAYGSWSRAFRSGGYNLRIAQVASFLAVADAAGTPAYDEERVDSFELGTKFQTADGRATLNLALYRTEVRDMQREVNVASATSGLSQSIYNTADARITGAEIETRFAVTPRFGLNANVGHIDAEYRNVRFDISSDGRIDAADAALAVPRAPEWTYGIGAHHQLPLGDSGAILTRADFQHRDRYAWTDNNFGWVTASDNLDASVTWRMASGLSVGLYGKNLLDEVQHGGDTQLGFAGGPLSDGDNRPFDPRPAAGTFSPLAKGRRIGVEVAFGF